MASELSPESRGKWLITTQGSQHVWDLDAMTYRRLPGEGRGKFAHDGRVVRITRVEAWPRIGQTFLLWFDDPEHPELLEHWRRSSRINNIEPLGGADRLDGGNSIEYPAQACETPES